MDLEVKTLVGFSPEHLYVSSLAQYVMVRLPGTSRESDNHFSQQITISD